MARKQKYSFKTTITQENGSRKNTPEYNKFLYHKNKKKLKKARQYYKKTELPKNIRKTILCRDNYECQICGQGEYLNIHHWNNNREDNSYWNLLTLCPACHRLVHAGMF